MKYTRLLDPGSGLRLHLNENTAGCSPAVLAALRGLERVDASFYPDYSDITTRSERWFDVPSGWVQLTNGLDEGLHVAAQWAARSLMRIDRRPTDPSVIIVEPAFEMYAACAEATGLAAVHIPPEADFRFPLEAILASISPVTRLIYLTDPNNPTGLGIPAGHVEQIAEAAPHVLVFVDEAYSEFSGRTLIGPSLDRRRNLVVGRTFAKAHGLAALRVGAVVAHPDTLEPLRRLLPPYSLNICAVRALGAALDDRAYLDWYVAESRESRELIYDFCRKAGLHSWPSEGNFVLVRLGEHATAVVNELGAQGVHIRDRSNQPGCAGCVRITAGVVDATRHCLKTLENTLAARSH